MCVCMSVCVMDDLNIPQRSKFSREFNLATGEFLNLKCAKIRINIFFALILATLICQGVKMLKSPLTNTLPPLEYINSYNCTRLKTLCCKKLTIRPFLEFTRCHLSKLSCGSVSITNYTQGWNSYSTLGVYCTCPAQSQH